MAEIQLRSGPSSASSHRSTQTSRTLNRHYVERPSNLFIDEAAQSVADNDPSTDAAPSRLVNLRVHASDLQRIQAEESTPEPIVEETPETPGQQQVVPRVVELGAGATAPTSNLDFNQIVPPEEVVEQPQIYDAPVSPEMSLAPVAQYPAEYTQPYNYNPTSVTQSPAEVDAQALAMNIAADYAAASFGASVADTAGNNYNTGLGLVSTSDNSIDAIAQAASEAIAAIRTATDPEEVAAQVASLQNFAANIRATSAAPEMLELSDTIDKFVGIAMKSANIQPESTSRKAEKTNSVKVAAKPVTSASRAASKPAARATTTRTSARRPMAAPATKSSIPKARPLNRRANKTAPSLVADEDQALRKALRSVAAMDDDAAPAQNFTRKKTAKSKGGRKRFALAFVCATACVAAVVYFVGVNIPDISVKVAAIQTGIEASYPSYVPRDFSLSDIDSENGKITMTFKGPDQTSFTLSEEKSSWDSTALLRNYVEPTWQDSYTTTHEQGVTVYISGANAAWVNGGVLYKITTPTSNSLTNKQLRNIVTSL